VDFCEALGRSGLESVTAAKGANMSYLHKLKQQAQALKNREQAHAQEQQRRDTFYQEHINPAMLKIGKFLAELTDNLNYVQPEVKVDYEILRDQWLQGLRHSKYVNYMDSSEQCKATSLLIECEGPRQIEFWINDSKESEKMTEFLFNRKVQFKQNKIHHMGQLRSQFEIHPKMTIRFDFNADIARSKIVLRITNFDKLGSEIHLLDPAQINDKFIEELTEFVVRERKEFLKV